MSTSDSIVSDVRDMIFSKYGVDEPPVLPRRYAQKTRAGHSTSPITLRDEIIQLPGAVRAWGRPASPLVATQLAQHPPS